VSLSARDGDSDSAGAKLAHNVVARAGTLYGNDIDIEDMIMLHAFFWAPDRPAAARDRWSSAERQTQNLVRAEEAGHVLAGLDGDPLIDPPAEVVASLPCRRALVAVAGKDLARHRGRRYAAWLRNKDEWCCEVTPVESESENHPFHLYSRARASAGRGAHAPRRRVHRRREGSAAWQNVFVFNYHL
jgi:hypothetical protein